MEANNYGHRGDLFVGKMNRRDINFINNYNISGEWIAGATWFTFVSNKNVWKCYNCLKNDNCMIRDLRCINCGLGIHPFYFFIKNQNFLQDCSILGKKFGLIDHSRNCSSNEVCCF